MGKGGRESAARARIKAQQAEQRKREQRKRVATMVTVGVVALGAVGLGWWLSARGGTPEAASGALAPVVKQADGTVVMAKPGVDKPVVDVYEDFQCPGCRQFEETSGPTLKNMAAAGQVKVVYHPITIFPEQFNNGITRGNSIRASVAARCTPDAQWSQYHDALFKNQPAETVEGFKIPDLVTWGKQTGITDAAFEKCVTSQKYAGEQATFSVNTITSAAIKGTPTLKLNGTEIDNTVVFKPADLRQAILNAAK
jgi:protein-disulfide isomerase